MTKKGRAYLLLFGIIITYSGLVFAIQIAAPDNPIEPENFPTNCPEDSINCSLIAPNHHRSEESWGDSPVSVPLQLKF